MTDLRKYTLIEHLGEALRLLNTDYPNDIQATLGKERTVAHMTIALELAQNGEVTDRKRLQRVVEEIKNELQGG